jgi:hypothetical protein
MFTAALPRILRSSLAAVLVCASVMTAEAVTAPSEGATPTAAVPSVTAMPTAPAGTAVTLRLGTTPAGRLTVITANVAEYLNARDNRQHLDLSNFARRTKLVLDAQRRAGQPVHTPDLVLLQEVDAATAVAVARRLSRVYHRHFAIAGGASRGLRPAAGRGAVVRHRTRSHALLTRATAVVYNTHTMRRPTSARMITFGYPKRQVWTSRQCRHARVSCQANMWESRQTPIFRIQAKRSGRTYAVASVHFVPYRFLKPRLNKRQRAGFREAQWITRLHATMARAYPHLQQIMAGDFNEYLCIDDGGHAGRPHCAGTPVTPMYGAVLAAPSYHWAIPSGIDHIFTQQRILASGKDTTYKQFDRVRQGAKQYLTAADYRTRIRGTHAFDQCDAAFSRGAGTSRAARRIPGCTSRYYSDHPFDWAVIG